MDKLPKIEDWNDIHFAYQVASLGTLSAAATHLGVHHATVLRHIESLEKRLNCKLFHRHPRGYVPTEAGETLLNIATTLESDLERLVGKLQGLDDSVQGKLIITTVESLISALAPILSSFQKANPNIQLEMLVDSRRLKLEHGEAHIGIRPGQPPQEPDYVAQNVGRLSTTLYASKHYIDTFGRFKGFHQAKHHRFISASEQLSHLDIVKTIEEKVPDENIIYRANNFLSMYHAVEQSMGIGPINNLLANRDPTLVALINPPQHWNTHLWLVTHRDIHRTQRVQVFLQHFKTQIAELIS